MVFTQHARAGAVYLAAEYLFCIGLLHSQVKLLFAVLAQHVHAGAEYLAAEYLFCIGLHHSQVMLLFMVLTQHVRGHHRFDGEKVAPNKMMRAAQAKCLILTLVQWGSC